MRVKEGVYFGGLYNGMRHGLGVLVTRNSVY